jgi:hypothetical protein
MALDDDLLERDVVAEIPIRAQLALGRYGQGAQSGHQNNHVAVAFEKTELAVHGERGILPNKGTTAMMRKAIDGVFLRLSLKSRHAGDIGMVNPLLAAVQDAPCSAPKRCA